MLFRQCQNHFNPGFVLAEFDGNFRRLIPDRVEQAVESRPVQKCEIDLLGLNVTDERVTICHFAPFRRADVIRDSAGFEEIENIRPSVHAAWLQRALLLGEIVKRNVLERDVIQIEVATKPKLRL